MDNLSFYKKIIWVSLAVIIIGIVLASLLLNKDAKETRKDDYELGKIEKEETIEIIEEAVEEIPVDMGKQFATMDPFEIISEMVILRKELATFQISVDTYMAQMKSVYKDMDNFEWEQTYVSLDERLYGLDFSKFTGMTTDDIKKKLEENGDIMMWDGVYEGLYANPYIDISQVYQDPNNEWEYVITVENFEDNYHVSYILSKYTFASFGGQKKIIMVDRDYKFSLEKNGAVFENMSEDYTHEDLVKSFDKSFAGSFYGEKVNYRERILLSEDGIEKELQNTDQSFRSEKIQIEDLKITEITPKELYYDTRYPLAAKIDDQDIYLYAQPKGAVIRIANVIKSLDGWLLTTPRHILPRLYTDDLDEDGVDEIICISNIGSGTGVSIDTVNVLKLNGKGNYDDYQISDNVDDIAEPITFSYDKAKNEVLVDSGRSSLVYKLDESYLDQEIEEATISSDVINYDYNEGIRIKVPMVLRAKNVPVPLFTWVEINGSVAFDDSGFHISWDTIEEACNR